MGLPFIGFVPLKLGGKQRHAIDQTASVDLGMGLAPYSEVRFTTIQTCSTTEGLELGAVTSSLAGNTVMEQEDHCVFAV